MRLVFAESSDYIALLLRNDAHHDAARRAGAALDREYTRWFTSQAVVFEVLAFFSRGGPASRARAAELVDRIRSSAAVELVPASSALFDAAISLYRSRLD